jgi:hypothetical protein
MDRAPFCAALSQAAQEDMIDTAPTHFSYVLIECPYPWAAQDMESKRVPKNLRDLVATVKSAKLPVRFLLFTGDRRSDSTRILLFRQQEGFSRGYLRRELQVETIADVAPLLSEYFSDRGFEIECGESEIQDYFICTHGSHDKCCAHFGYPFYREAKAILTDLDLPHVRVWQVSHIGGHRFAPTFVSFPEGRYYGAVNSEGFKAIVERKGNIDCLRTMYRGWGILPKQAQVVERELLLQYGWELLQAKVACLVTSVTNCATVTQVELCYQLPGGDSLHYGAEVFEDERKTQYLLGSCGNQQLSKFIKYTISKLENLSGSRYTLTAQAESRSPFILAP